MTEQDMSFAAERLRDLAEECVAQAKGQLNWAESYAADSAEQRRMGNASMRSALRFRAAADKLEAVVEQ